MSSGGPKEFHLPRFALCCSALSFLGAVLALSAETEAQHSGKVPQIGFLTIGSGSDPQTTLSRDAFRQRLSDLGYVEGKNINLQYRYAEGKSERLPELAEELVRLKVDMVVGTDSTSASSSQKINRQSFRRVYNRRQSYCDRSCGESRAAGRQCYGCYNQFPGVGWKTTRTSEGSRPQDLSLCFSYARGQWDFEAMLNDAQETAKALGIKFQLVEVKASNPDLEGAFRLMVKEGIGGLVTEGPPTISLHRKRILGLAAQHRLPAIHTEQVWADSGGLMSYGANRVEPFRRAAVYADKILKGAKPAELPVEQPTKFELVINLKTAKQIGLTIPANVLARADKVIK